MAESQVTEADFVEDIERIGESFLLADLGEELNRFVHGQSQHVVDRLVVQFNFEHVRLEPFPFTLRAADIEIAQKLHLNLFKAGPGTAFAAAAAGIEGKRARGQALRHRFRLGGKEFAHAIVKPEVKNRR